MWAPGTSVARPRDGQAGAWLDGLQGLPGPAVPSAHFALFLFISQDQTHVAARTPPPSSSAGGKETAVITHGIAACQALPGALHVLTLHPPATASAGS